jgi:hypothetical protein
LIRQLICSLAATQICFSIRRSSFIISPLTPRLRKNSTALNSFGMSKAQILEELPKLTVSDRSQLFARLAELHEADLVDGSAPTAAERQALDGAFAEFERDPSPGEPWRKVFSEIRKPR